MPQNLTKNRPAVALDSPQAAVALIRTAGPNPDYLLLKRAINPRDPWSGHFALPGGRQEEGDGGLLETCLRETREECGIILHSKQLLRKLPWLAAGHILGRPILVAPFLFEIADRPAISLDSREIASSHWVGSDYLLNPANHGQARLNPLQPLWSFPCIWLDSGAIWGFTYAVLAATGGLPPFPGHAEAGPASESLAA